MRNPYFEQRAAAFHEQLLAPETDVYDSDGTHSEFNQGLHGRKVDCDNIAEGTKLYEDWIGLSADLVWQSLPKRTLGKVVLIGIANGTNRIARDTADMLGCVTALETYKNEEGRPELTPEAIEILKGLNPAHARFLEDVSSRGTNVMWATASLHTNRPSSLEDIEAHALFERGVPVWLASIGLKYRAIIRHHMLDFEPDQCKTRPMGYCANNWELKPYKRSVEV